MENDIKEVQGLEGYYILSKVKIYEKIIELSNNSFLVNKNNEFEIQKKIQKR